MNQFVNSTAAFCLALLAAPCYAATSSVPDAHALIFSQLSTGQRGVTKDDCHEANRTQPSWNRPIFTLYPERLIARARQVKFVALRVWCDSLGQPVSILSTKGTPV